MKKPFRDCLVVFLASLFVFLGARRSAQTIRSQYNPVPREVIDKRLQRFSTKDAEREATLKKIFEEAGCQAEYLTEHPVKHERLPNLVCTLPGTSDLVIIVGAHFDHLSRGKGVVDNWSGAVLLPSLLQSLSDQPRKYTFVFVAFTNEEHGLVGSKFYAKQLTPEQITKTRAMVNLDSLGLGPTKIWLSHSDKQLVGALLGVARSMNLPLQAVNADQVGDDDSEPFMRRKVPTLMLHSVTQDRFGILHSSLDDLAAVRLNDYYDTYRLLAAYLAYLDTALN